MTRKSFAFAIATGAALVALCAIGSWAQHAEVPALGGVTKAVAVLHATKKGGDVHGKISFTQTPKGILVEGTIEGLTPGLHGFHVHEFGDCGSDDAMSAGGHFNPTNMPHAGPHADKRHVGDLGNIEANDKGVAKIDLHDSAITLSGAHSIIGRGLIVHAKADDLKSAPAGAAGDRVACGVIGVAKAAGMMSGTAPAKK
ncbi:superoxide dismutase, Cu-Zn family [Singulisphaera sp. GP187]|uniref:superoxide dismutase family protein n=1 Tax=Singulisphaera sp. GP187 TaxID=1882752 RepID=UPI0009269217|nr:superoxide dismutase family protein [Singulisphaera sp. GP187]SIO38686.1 superoxide dismutase, Cu-Zn family [Singulisphaera sp. GP187]